MQHILYPSAQRGCAPRRRTTRPMDRPFLQHLRVGAETSGILRVEPASRRTRSPLAPCGGYNSPLEPRQTTWGGPAGDSCPAARAPPAPASWLLNPIPQKEPGHHEEMGVEQVPGSLQYLVDPESVQVPGHNRNQPGEAPGSQTCKNMGSKTKRDWNRWGESSLRVPESTQIKKKKKKITDFVPK